MRRPPLVSASLRKRRFLCLEREERDEILPHGQCNKSAVTTPAAAYPLRLIRYGTTSIPSIHHPTDRPTNNNGLEMSKRESTRSDIIIIHITITQRTNARSTSCISTYLPFSPSDTRPTRPNLTLPHLPFLGSHPKRKTSSQIHPSERTGPVVISLRYPSQMKYYSPKALVTTLH